MRMKENISHILLKVGAGAEAIWSASCLAPAQDTLPRLRLALGPGPDSALTPHPCSSMNGILMAAFDVIVTSVKCH